MTWLHSQPFAVILSDRLDIVVRLPYNRTRLMFSLLPDKPSFVCLLYIDCTSVCVFCVFYFRPFVFLRGTEAPTPCFGIYSSMYACRERLGSSEPCLFVIYQKDKEPKHRSRILVSISWNDRWEANVHREQNIAWMFFLCWAEKMALRKSIFISYIWQKCDVSWATLSDN